MHASEAAELRASQSPPPGLDSRLLDLQSGFRAGRSTVEQVATLRCVIDDCRTRQKDVSIVFVDFRKAFDSVCRPAIAWLLNIYSVPPSVQRLFLIAMDYILQLFFRPSPTPMTSPFSAATPLLLIEPSHGSARKVSESGYTSTRRRRKFSTSFSGMRQLSPFLPGKRSPSATTSGTWAVSSYLQIR